MSDLLPRLASALRKFGVECYHRLPLVDFGPDDSDIETHPERVEVWDQRLGGVVTWDGVSELPDFAFFFRDLVRRVAQTAIVSVDFDGKTLTHAIDFDWTPETWDKNPGVPSGTGYQPNETSAWAAAAVALDEAGLVPEVGNGAEGGANRTLGAFNGQMSDGAGVAE